MPPLTITSTEQRRFILGQQGLYPGRRWRGKAGVMQALNAGAVVQVDPLNVIARSPDISLYGRVLDYRAAMLDELLHSDRLAFDWGGTVMIYPMHELPYWRVAMERKVQQPRPARIFEQHANVITDVLATVRERGALSSRDFKISATAAYSTGFRTTKVAGQALYVLWLAGELMSHSRGRTERRYDLRERIAPAEYAHKAAVDEAESYFARRCFDYLGIATPRTFRGWWAGAIERSVSADEAADRLAAMLSTGQIVEIRLEGDAKTPRYIAADFAPHLEAIRAGRTPDAWQALDTTTDQEVTFLAPLEIVSTRGRAKPLFDFDYLWEVYKPVHKRRWGYYTLPILYGDRLVARLDPKLDRATKTVHIQGYWLEDWFTPDAAYNAALQRGLERLMGLAGAASFAPNPPLAHAQ